MLVRMGLGKKLAEWWEARGTASPASTQTPAEVDWPATPEPTALQEAADIGVDLRGLAEPSTRGAMIMGAIIRRHLSDETLRAMAVAPSGSDQFRTAMVTVIRDRDLFVSGLFDDLTDSTHKPFDEGVTSQRGQLWDGLDNHWQESAVELDLITDAFAQKTDVTVVDAVESFIESETYRPALALKEGIPMQDVGAIVRRACDERPALLPYDPARDGLSSRSVLNDIGSGLPLGLPW